MCKNEERRAVCKKINDHITLISDKGEATCYVVCGKDYAAVIDTLQGKENLLEIVREITDLPLIVINTHGHCDHVYGNVFFNKTYLNKRDHELMKLHFSLKEGLEVINKFNSKPCPVEDINEGDVIDLGGITLEAIETPGHTRGSICLLDKQDRILFSGDSVNGYLWMFLPDSTSLAEMNVTLKKLMNRQSEFDFLLTGHWDGLVNSMYINKEYDGILEILNGQTQDDTDEECVGIKCRIHTYGDEKLRIYYKIDHKKRIKRIINLIERGKRS